MSRRNFRPCPSCGKTTTAKTELCAHCRPRKAIRPEVKCECGRRTMAKSGKCDDCRHARPISAPATAHELTGGHWLNVRGVMRYVPHGAGYDWVARQEATTARVKELLAERSDLTWWKRPPLADDPQVTARRLAAMAENFDGIHARAAS